ncbi:hypothetical protein [Humidisolicoccus flavus]|uniref:hypothetical protein n=1 Tax=Humidisolicoccus flavus TaxID=3111414 RepID=UPI003243686E
MEPRTNAGPFPWIADVQQGEWLRVLEREPFGSLLSIVPRGYEAYARVFHPLSRDRPRGVGSWHGVDRDALFAGVQDIDSVIETESATWADAAKSFGTTLHAHAQLTRLFKLHGPEDWYASGAVAADGWQYEPAEVGSLESQSFTRLASVLARHTRTPDHGVAAVWEGWGGLMSAAGYAEITLFEDGTTSTSGGWSGEGEEPPPGSGLLSQEIASGPTLAVHGGTGRNYVLFAAGASDFAEASWPERAPWVRRATSGQSPSILWPEDRSWVLATEIDYDSTLIAGSLLLVRELVAASGVEVLPIRPDQNLHADGDDVNRPSDEF